MRVRSAKRSGQNQHYVPRLLLRNFVDRSSRASVIRAYDKRDLRIFRVNISKIASEIDYNVIDTPDGAISVEDFYSNIESRAAPVISKIRNTRSLASLGLDERRTVAIFASSIFLRTKQRRDEIKAIGRRAKCIATRNFGSEAAISSIGHIDSDEYAKVVSSGLNFDSVEAYAVALLDKDWILLQPGAGDVFVLSDSPVVMHNDNDFSPYGSLGFLVPGIYIYLPIAFDLAMGFWCPSIRGRFIKIFNDGFRGIREVEYLKRQGYSAVDDGVDHNLSAYMRSILEAHSYTSAIESGGLCTMSTNAVRHMNILQVYYSSRFVLGEGCADEYIQKYYSAHPEARTPIKLRLD